MSVCMSVTLYVCKSESQGIMVNNDRFIDSHILWIVYSFLHVYQEKEDLERTFKRKGKKEWKREWTRGTIWQK